LLSQQPRFILKWVLEWRKCKQDYNFTLNLVVLYSVLENVEKNEFITVPVGLDLLISSKVGENGENVDVLSFDLELERKNDLLLSPALIFAPFHAWSKFLFVYPHSADLARVEVEQILS